ncbi:MAG TPA: arginase, partial [Gaiellaceae bacterium]|nr:arginase [Gaiellaceae bacterium]
MAADTRVAIIGAELDLGAGRRGVDMGPSAIRYAGLGERLEALGIPAQDWGNVFTNVRETIDPGDRNARFLSEIRETCERIAEQVRNAADSGMIPLVLGGDHSVAIGTIGGLASLHGPGGVLWFDAHSDLNAPATTPTGNVHGMPVAAALGRAGAGFESNRWPLPALALEHVALIGVRSIDPGERVSIGESGIAVYTISDIDRRGVEPVLREALERVSAAPFVHISLDLDIVDPDVAPGVGSPVRGGLSYRE